MGLLKNIVMVAILIAVAYYGAGQFGLLAKEANFQELDEKYGLSGARLAPATMQELESYGAELRSIKTSDAEQKRIISLRLELAEMQKSLLRLSAQNWKISAQTADCTFTGPVFTAKGEAQEVLAFAEKALQLGKSLNAKGKTFLSGEDFESALNGVKSAMLESMAFYGTLC